MTEQFNVVLDDDENNVIFLPDEFERRHTGSSTSSSTVHCGRPNQMVYIDQFELRSIKTHRNAKAHFGV